MRKVYISGKITGLEETATRERFLLAQGKWLGRGYDVVNPFAVYDFLKQEKICELNWANIMVYDLFALKDCGVIYMLDGWMDSPGARIERDFASRLGLEVIYEDTTTENIIENGNRM